MRDFEAAHDDLTALDFCMCPDEAAIGATDGKPFEQATARFEAVPDMVEAEDNLVLSDSLAVKGWPRELNRFAVSDSSGSQRESRTDGCFAGRMDVFLIAHVGDDDHANLG